MLHRTHNYYQQKKGKKNISNKQTQTNKQQTKPAQPVDCTLTPFVPGGLGVPNACMSLFSLSFLQVVFILCPAPPSQKKPHPSSLRGLPVPFPLLPFSRAQPQKEKKGVFYWKKQKDVATASQNRGSLGAAACAGQTRNTTPPPSFPAFLPILDTPTVFFPPAGQRQTSPNPPLRTRLPYLVPC